MDLYNTLTRKKEVFKAIKEGEVLFYQCGPTVYFTQHIGNLRAMVLSDLIRRTFLYNGYQVKFVRNYTDVGHLVSDGDSGEDKMEKGAKREGLSPIKIAEKYIKIFEDDIKDLNTLEPAFKPKATEYIKEMQVMVQDLLDKGFAYSTPLAVYFDISKAKDYTRLSGQNLEKNREGAGVGDVEDPQKKNSADFALWFFRAGKHKEAIQFWPSPFVSPLVEKGEGFPGWHIECSAMIKALLGETIDVHMGGIEHISVHHTNEIAQSESVNGVPLANYWLHNEWLTVNNGKMAKSEGTGFSLAEVKEKGFNPLALRYFFLQANYRSKQNFTWEAMQSAQTGFDRLVNNVSALGEVIGKVDDSFRKEFLEKINNDFNAPQALALTFAVLKSALSSEDKLATILDFDKVLGLNLK
ncbi:MAG: cysteine--tRNA ligase [Candidatus Taylorbacteria bacterium RIFOXYD2_FULL_36_9]|uniref:Cysteine--tRNA ligase n=1 Tax=Candidatus Taylorbacteria bacterium RIFOXYD2_FULL_36_9 TaxID=1802338 RepID=A0A1G2PDX4_9BACT|nr:MAG: cysteine--tRNA ligase [Candidatus Taylorbacteria bacterium RIFOXYD2_FULL_36_9]